MDIQLPGLSAAGLKFILDELDQSRILREEEGIYELAHDTLSLRISEQRSAAEIALLEISELIQGMMRAFEHTGAWLNSRELRLIENYESQLREEGKLSPKAWQFIADSQQANRRAQQRKTMTVSGVIGGLAILLGLAGWQWWVANERFETLKIAQADIVKREMEKKDDAVYALDYELAYNIIKDAVKLNTPTDELRKGMLELAYYYHEIGNPTHRDTLLQLFAQLDQQPMEIPKDKKEVSALIRKWAGEDQFNSWENRYYPVMVEVTGGTFWMGDTLNRDEQPIHQVRLDDFQIGQTEITVYQYELYLKSTGKTLDSVGYTPSWLWQGDNPMVYVDWYDAVRYSNWLSERMGLKPVYTIDGQNTKADSTASGYRLPTEAEWEYAAGGGRKGRDTAGYRKHLYAGSDVVNTVGWYYYDSDSLTGVRRALPVALKQPNELDLYDMSGNVWEWCQDGYAGNYYHRSPTNNPKGLTSWYYRVLRGGSWYDGASNLRVAYRSGGVPDGSDNDVGFRLARSP